ncbi:MAG: hypothetical protein JSS61_02665 [Verrucomicrobia bacterium]|nr:hypothetical protein [Verrucomicrobiota bacterium]
MGSWIFLLITLLLPSIGALALYQGNPSFPLMPEQGLFIPSSSIASVKIGYVFDDVFDRKMRMVGQGNPGERSRVKDFGAMTQLGTVTLNLIQRIEAYAGLGVLNMHLSQRPFSEEKIAYRTDWQFAWEVGGRALIAYWGNLHLGISAAYLQSDPSVSSLKVDDSSYKTGRADLFFREWQVGMALSYHLNWFIPYTGLAYSDLRLKFHHLASLSSIFPSHHVTFEDRHPLSFVIGFGIAPKKFVDLNVEARFFGETALTASCDLAF